MPAPGNYGAITAVGLLSLMLLLVCLSRFSVGLIATGIALLGASVVMWIRRHRKIAWFTSHHALLKKVTATPDQKLMDEIAQSIKSSQYDAGIWVKRHEEVYSGVLLDALADGINENEKEWVDNVARALQIRDQATVDTAVLQSVLWSLMADNCVTKEEEKLVEQLIQAVGLSADDLSVELGVMDQFVRGREARESGPPVIDPGINLQKNEQCHHHAKGALLEKKVLRSYTRGGQRFKEEGLQVVKEGDIYITSKRILVVSDGTSSIPHEKILDVEVDADDRCIEITKDGRQKPLYIRVPDVIYAGMLIELLSEKAST
jgi:hypothetical protein